MIFWDFFFRAQRWFNICMPVTGLHISNIKDKIIISIDAVKTFDNTKLPFMIKKKTLQQNEYGWNKIKVST